MKMDHDNQIKKRSVLIAGHRTSVSLEQIFWRELKEIAVQRGISINQLIVHIDEHRQGNLSSAVRVYVMQHVIKRIS
jgi:predicted DNA-binding ribbon-helix-helix protein